MKNQEEKALAVKIRVFSLMVAKLSKGDLERRLEGQKTGITAPAYGVLHLVRHGVSTIHDLSNHMMIAPATLVPMVDLLERKGFLRRGKDSSDRRKNPLTLTAKGKSLLAKVPLVSSDDRLVSCLNRMGAQKSRELVATLEQLVTLMRGDSAMCERLDSIINTQLHQAPKSSSSGSPSARSSSIRSSRVRSTSAK